MWTFRKLSLGWIAGLLAVGGCSEDATDTSPVCEISPASMEFGTIFVDSTSLVPATITNVGGGTLSGSVALAAGPACSTFTIVSGGGAYSLGSGESQTIRVVFAPAVDGPAQCNLVTGCETIPMSGLGNLLPFCEVSPANLEFGTVFIGTSATLPLSVTNTGTNAITGTATIAGSCADLWITNPAFDIPSGQSLDLQVNFVPQTEGAIADCRILLGTVGSCDTVDVTATARRMDPGDVAFIEGNNTQYTFNLPSAAGSEEYLLIVNGAVASLGPYSYALTAGGASFPPQPVPSVAPQQAPNLPVAFENHIRSESALRANDRRRGAPATPSSVKLADTSSFKVLRCVSCSVLDSTNFVTVDAERVYDGTGLSFYADLNQPAGSFDTADYDEIAQEFEQILQTNRSFFGSTTDINGDGKVVVLFTPVVNDLTPDGMAAFGFIPGFFLQNDMAPALYPAGTSNGLEILYMMVPDPNGERGNTFDKTLVKDQLPYTFAHESEHLISYGHRFTNFGLTAAQASWLEEGLAHVAEQLNGLDAGNTTRVALYLSKPAEVPIEGGNTLEERGAAFLLLRYLGDRFGSVIFRTIVENSCVGGPCIEQVTGEPFQRTFGDFLAMLYLSDRGITSDPKYNMTFFNMQTDFNPVAVEQRTVAQGPFSGSVNGGAGQFILMTALPSPQIFVNVRTGRTLHTVVARTQ